MQYHSFLPFSLSALVKDDEIRIPIQNMDSYTLPCKNHIYVEGRVNVLTDVGQEVGLFVFTNIDRCLFLFFEMRYEINGVEIRKLIFLEISRDCVHTP